jgi:RIO kinase 1
MRIPDSLAPLVDYGIVQDVIRPLMSGKEAQVFVVVSGGKQCVAKVYKEAQNRTFKNRAEYTEGRKVRNTRDQRAMEKRSKHGRAQDEAAWRSTEVDVIHRLHAAGVRVPVPHHFVDGVLIMELITGLDGNPAPRLADVEFTRDGAQALHDRLIREVTKMLCAGIVHGDLSDFNVLIGADGPVIIDFPQSVDTAQNTNARKLLLRDVGNVHSFLSRFVPGVRRMAYAEEMWDLYQQNVLTPETKLTGRHQASQRPVNTREVLDLIQDANYDERKRRDALGLRGGPPAQPRFTPRPSAPAPTYVSPQARQSQQSQGRQPGRPPQQPSTYVSPQARQSQPSQPSQQSRGGQPGRPAPRPNDFRPRPPPSDHTGRGDARPNDPNARSSTGAPRRSGSGSAPSHAGGHAPAHAPAAPRSPAPADPGRARSRFGSDR